MVVELSEIGLENKSDSGDFLKAGLILIGQCKLLPFIYSVKHYHPAQLPLGVKKIHFYI